ncbi:MAG: peptidoglycan DD-metalloendopeptidase family protein [Nitrospirota bacterium]
MTGDNRQPAIVCILCTVFCILFSVSVYAVTPQEEYEKVQEGIREHKKKLEDTKRLEYSILGELDNANKQLNIIESELRKTRRKLANTESKIAKVEKEISLNKSKIERQKEWIKRKLRAIQKHGYNTEAVMVLLSANDISQFMRRAKYLQYIAVHETQLLNSYKESIESLYAKEKQLTTLKTDLIRDKEKIKSEEASLLESKKNKEILLASIKNEKASYEKMLKELKDAAKRLLEIIREAEMGDSFSAEGFRRLKGKLPWPVNGRVVIPYGAQKDPLFNTRVFRSGAYIRAGENSFARAIYSGRVVFAEWFKGYGQLVIINHGGGYHTLYGSLSEIFTKVGDIITPEQIIGRVGDSGILNMPALYFELRYKGKPLDPAQWLTRR